MTRTSLMSGDAALDRDDRAQRYLCHGDDVTSILVSAGKKIQEVFNGHKAIGAELFGSPYPPAQVGAYCPGPGGGGAAMRRAMEA